MSDGLLGHPLPLCDQHPPQLGDVEGSRAWSLYLGRVLDGLGVDVLGGDVLENEHQRD